MASAIQQHELATGIYVSPPSGTLLPPPSPPFLQVVTEHWIWGPRVIHQTAVDIYYFTILLEAQCKSPSAKTKVCSVLWFFLWARGNSFLDFSSSYMVPTFLQSQLPSSKLLISNATSLRSFFHNHFSLWLVTAGKGSLIIKSHVIPLGHLGESRITVQSRVLDLRHMCKVPFATKRKLFTSCRDESMAIFQGLSILPTPGTFQG